MTPVTTDSKLKIVSGRSVRCGKEEDQVSSGEFFVKYLLLVAAARSAWPHVTIGHPPRHQESDRSDFLPRSRVVPGDVGPILIIKQCPLVWSRPLKCGPNLKGMIDESRLRYFGGVIHDRDTSNYGHYGQTEYGKLTHFIPSVFVS
jgi:hypothetical protein